MKAIIGDVELFGSSDEIAEVINKTKGPKPSRKDVTWKPGQGVLLDVMGNRKNSRWTANEDAYLKQFPNDSIKFLSRKLKRTGASIRARRTTLGIRRAKH